MAAGHRALRAERVRGASPSSIEVWIDEEAATTGWPYDAAAEGIVFEYPHYPAPGSRVRIDYTMLECPW